MMSKKKERKFYYIETYGCQMNKYDSELVASLLQKSGYEETSNYENADLVFVNTCSVRENAEVRALGRISALNALRQKKPHLILGVLGCMAARIGEQILDEKSYVNLALGPDNYRQIPDLLKKLEQPRDGGQEFATVVSDFENYENIYPTRVSGITGWVAIMRGCNNFCAYCIVPYLRGRERSRSKNNILEEIHQLVADSYKEVTLLGQNVNSYHDGETDFPDLLLSVARETGIERVRFASSHPKDLSARLIQAIADEPKICNHIHLAVQAGSNQVLKRMNRRYTREHYLQLLAQAREKVPEISFTTDIIVGFPGETEADFEDTLELIRQAQFDNAFTFKYNPRSGTAAAQIEDSVSPEEKQRRLEALIELQNEITLRQNRSHIGQVWPVLVESTSKKSAEKFRGRTDTNKIVIFPAGNFKIGDIVRVKINAAEGHTLFGSVE